MIDKEMCFAVGSDDDSIIYYIINPVNASEDMVIDGVKFGFHGFVSRREDVVKFNENALQQIVWQKNSQYEWRDWADIFFLRTKPIPMDLLEGVALVSVENLLKTKGSK